MAAPPGALSLERWTVVEPVFDRALDLARENRADFLEQACSHDPALLEEVERLLQASEATDDLLDRSAAVYASPLVARVAERRGPAAGEWLGPYLIEGELGRGGMATVYLAHDPRHARRVALKVLRPEVSGALGSGRFAREIAIAARLSHPHILPLYDSGTLALPDGPPVVFYTMPYVAGHSLRDRLRAAPQLPVAEALEIARQVAAALDYAHREGVVHRDIKPENILLGEGGARVADFGIARALDAAGGERLTETGLALGTPAYMSPEQASASARLDGRADLYALGCVLYEMLAGEPPFTGSSAQAVLARHARDPVPSLRTVCPGVSPELGRVVMRALAKVPADRFPSAGAFSSALDLALEVGAIAESRTGSAETRSHGRRVLVAVGLALAAGLATAAALTARAHKSPPVTIDRAVVAVMPFRLTAADPALGYLKEGIVDLLTAKLGGTLALRPLNSRTLLSAWRDAGGGVTEPEALGLAARLGAGQLIEGDIAGERSRLTVSASLLQGPREGVPATRVRVSVDGPADSIEYLVDRLAARLLVLSAGEPEERLADLAREPLPLLRLYLDGWTMVRRGDAEHAFKSFQAAFTVDTGFTLAAVGMARADVELRDPRIPGPGREAALRVSARLSARDKAYLAIIAGGYTIQDRPRKARERVERFLRRAPRDPEAWRWYGVSLTGGLLPARVPDDLVRGLAAYGRALELDSSYTPVLSDYTGMAALAGDTAAMRRGLRALTARDSVSPVSRMVQWQVASALGDSITARRLATSDSLLSTRADDNVGPAWGMTLFVAGTGLGGRDAELELQRSYDAAPTTSQRNSLAVQQCRLAILRGHWDCVRQSRQERGEWWTLFRVLEGLFADGDPELMRIAASTLDREVGHPIHGDCCLARALAAEYAIVSGNTPRARRALADILRFRASSPDTAENNPLYSGYAILLGAQIAAEEGTPDAGGRLAQLDSALADPSLWPDYLELLGNLISARLHERRGEFAQALAAIQLRDITIVSPVHTTYYRDEGRIAAEAGDTLAAIRAYRRYLGVRGEAEPRLQPQVRQVRAELAELERRAGPH